MFGWNFMVHKESTFKRYYASPVSLSFFVVFACGLTLMLLPIFISYNSWGLPLNNSGFWFKEGTYYEQPHVSYQHEGVVELHGRSGSDPLNIYYSTSPSLNKKSNGIMRSGVIQSASFDDNNDGNYDRIVFDITMSLKSGEEILGMNSIFFHELRLNDKAKLKIDTLTHINYEGGDIPIKSVNIGGDIVFKQTEVLQAGGKYKVSILIILIQSFTQTYFGTCTPHAIIFSFTLTNHSFLHSFIL
jgi:hypothetical protein